MQHAAAVTPEGSGDDRGGNPHTLRQRTEIGIRGGNHHRDRSDHRPDLSKTGAAAEALPSVISLREMANPVERISASARCSVCGSVMVCEAIRGSSPARISSRVLESPKAKSTFPGPVACNGRR